MPDQSYSAIADCEKEAENFIGKSEIILINFFSVRITGFRACRHIRHVVNSSGWISSNVPGHPIRDLLCTENRSKSGNSPPEPCCTCHLRLLCQSDGKAV
jgi:hypothetical protein